MNNSLAASVFLIRLKKLIDENKLLFRLGTDKNKAISFNEGLPVLDVLNYVKSLTPENFYSGPIPEGFTVRRDGKGNNVIVDGKSAYNYAEQDITNYCHTGNENYLNKFPETSNPMAVVGMIATAEEALGLESESIIPGLSTKELLSIIALGAEPVGKNSSKISGLCEKTIRVGRWMCKEEYNKMVSTGKVQLAG